MTVLNLSLAYHKSQRALDIQSLTLPRGQACAVIGANGVGKSTFARCLCGLEHRSQGVLWIDGSSYGRRSRTRHCFMVMQDVNHQLFANRVLDEVLLSMRPPEGHLAEEVCAALGLLELKELHPQSLSGGQRQRVAIASAVASRREVIVFDEPTSGLDYLHMMQVSQSIRQLEAQGRTILVITHDPELVLTCCSHVVQMEKGKVLADYPLSSAGRRRMLEFFIDASEDSDSADDAPIAQERRRQ
jgi:energy-coupling factor transport system ATP-binding protein